MPTTELPMPAMIIHSKTVSPRIEITIAQSPPARMGILAKSHRGKWLLATSFMVLLAIGAIFYFRGPAQPAYRTAAIDRGDQDLTKMQVDTNVDESDAGPIRVSQQANFTADAYPGIIFPGVVSQIRQAPINVQNVVTYDVVVEVSNADLKLFPGMTANVKIVTGRAEHALRLPVAALRFHPAAAAPAGAAKSPSKSGGRASSGAPVQQAVYVLDNGKPKRAPVQLGAGVCVFSAGRCVVRILPGGQSRIHGPHPGAPLRVTAGKRSGLNLVTI